MLRVSRQTDGAGVAILIFEIKVRGYPIAGFGGGGGWVWKAPEVVGKSNAQVVPTTMRLLLESMASEANVDPGKEPSVELRKLPKLRVLRSGLVAASTISAFEF